MTNRNSSENRARPRILRIACCTALAVAFTVSLPRLARAGNVTPPDVPDEIRVPAGNRAFLKGHGVGTQNYICLPCPNPSTPPAACPDASGFAWLLFTPEATLFNDNSHKPVTTHFFSPNPAEDGKIRATWQHSRDTSIVWGGQATSYSKSDFVADGAIPWLLLPTAGVQAGPTGGDTLTKTSFIQRVNTSLRVAPGHGCAGPEDVGAKAFQPYEADYFFYTRDDDN